MNEDLWISAARPMEMLGFLRVGRGRALLRKLMSKNQCLRKLRLFLVACCHRIEDLLTDERSRQAIAVAERQADGGVSPSEIAKAQSNAGAVYKALRSRSNVSAYTAAGAVMEMTRLTERQAFSLLIYVADLAVLARSSGSQESGTTIDGAARACDLVRTAEEKAQADYLRDIVGNLFRRVIVESSWKTTTVAALARQMYESGDFGTMPILADALEEAGCDNAEILAHCRGPGPHVRGCWVVDLILGKK